MFIEFIIVVIPLVVVWFKHWRSCIRGVTPTTKWFTRL